VLGITDLYLASQQEICLITQYDKHQPFALDPQPVHTVVQHPHTSSLSALTQLYILWFWQAGVHGISDLPGVLLLFSAMLPLLPSLPFPSSPPACCQSFVAFLELSNFILLQPPVVCHELHTSSDGPGPAGQGEGVDSGSLPAILLHEHHELHGHTLHPLKSLYLV